MAKVEVVGKGRVAIKMLNPDSEAYTEYLGYATRDLYAETDSTITTAYLNGITAVANLMDGSYVGNRISYEFEVSS